MQLEPIEPMLPAALVETLNELDSLRSKRWIASPLEGGITNQSFLIQADAGADAGPEQNVGTDRPMRFVLRLTGKGTEKLGINREQEALCARAAAECGAGCEVIAFMPEHGALLSRFAPGTALAAGDLEDPAVLARVVRALRLFHATSEVPGTFCPFTTASDYLEIAREASVRLPEEFDALAQRLKAVQAELSAENKRVPCHNDLLPANLIDDGERVRFIDWEYAAMGDVWFDLGNLAENNELSQPAERVLLELYFGEPRADDFGRLRRMRFASAMREAAWGFAQVAISTLEFDFEGYAWKHSKRAKTLSGES